MEFIRQEIDRKCFAYLCLGRRLHLPQKHFCECVWTESVLSELWWNLSSWGWTVSVLHVYGQSVLRMCMSCDGVCMRDVDV